LLRSPVRDIFPQGIINIHPSLLPHQRGAHPNVWSIIERTPAGVTLHYIDEGIDTGDIVASLPVNIAASDTAESLYRKLEQASVELFQQTWPRIVAGNLQRRPQPPAGSVHRVKDLSRLDEIDPNRLYSGRELIDWLRARTFPPHRGASIVLDGERVELQLSLKPIAEHGGADDEEHRELEPQQEETR